MRRGLISRSLLELPDAVLDARLDRLRTAMQDDNFDALVIYTNNTRPAGVSWLTGFVPYWSEALLVVPREGATYLVAALSFRVKSWIERTSRIGEVLHTPRVGFKAGQQIAAVKSDAAVGVIDFDGLPAGIAEDFSQGGSRLQFRDASALFARLRGQADAAEIGLAVQAATIARRALAEANRGARGTDALGAVIAGVERQARLLGAEEIYIAAAADLDRDWRLRRIEGDVPLGQNFALRATLAYKGTWIRLVRSFCDGARVRQATQRFADAVTQLPDDRGFAGFRSWLVEGCRMAQPLDPLIGAPCNAGHRPQPGAIVSVQGAVAIDGATVLVGAPALIDDHGKTAKFIVDPLFD